MKSSCGSETRHSWSTVRPPTPESNIPIGCAELSSRARPVRTLRLDRHEEDRDDDDQAGDRPDRSEPARDFFEFGAQSVACLQVAFGDLPCLGLLRTEESMLEPEQGDDR